jgi:peptidoglycan/LPS O-acetylase OafA/YrhL
VTGDAVPLEWRDDGPMNATRRRRSAERMPPSRRQIAFSALRMVVLSTGLVVAYSLAPLDRPGNLLGVKLLLALVIVAALLALQITWVLHSPSPRLRALEAVVVSLPLLIIIFATTYVVLSRNVPSSFNEHLDKISALYFTVTVFATVGFGDIVAHTDQARIIVTVQMAVDLIAIGVFAKVLLGAVQMRMQSRGDQNAASSRRDDTPSQGPS